MESERVERATEEERMKASKQEDREDNCQITSWVLGDLKPTPGTPLTTLTRGGGGGERQEENTEGEKSVYAVTVF